MSLPRELVDELLSRYMDGELSHDERQRVEQMLEGDQSLRESLRRLREESSLVHSAIRGPASLGPAFADRVFAAAVSQAERDGVSATHPLRLAAREHAEAAGRRASTAGRRAVVSGLFALAAGIALAALFFRGPAQEQSTVAIDTPNPTRSDPTLETLTPEAPTELAVSADGEPRNGAPRDGVPVDSTTDTISGSAPIEAIAVAEVPAVIPAGPTGVPSPATADGTVSTPVESIAVRPPTTPSDGAAQGEIPAGMTTIRAMFVYEVYLTPRGRENGVINRAFSTAKIRVGNLRPVDQTLVSHLTRGGIISGVADDPRSTDNGVELVFLEGSGRRLEQLMMELMEAREEVDRVGFNMVMDPPVFAAIDHLQAADPTEIRSIPDEAVALRLTPAGTEDPLSTSARFLAGSRQFQPLAADGLGMMSDMGSLGASEQPDITTQVLLVIRDAE